MDAGKRTLDDGEKQFLLFSLYFMILVVRVSGVR